jgi:type I restriction enzyme S subunit
MIEGLKPYPEYKESGSRWLGSVPTSWQVHNLRTLTTRRNERNQPTLPLLSVAREKGVFVRSLTGEDENHNVLPEDLSSYKVARAGNLVINKMKAWQGSMGIAPCDGVVSPAYYVFEFRIANRSFGQALLRSKPYVAHFGQSSDGVRVGQWDLSIPGMRQIPVVVPPPEEQGAIVRFLDYANRRIERYIRAKKKLIALLNEQKQAVIHRAVIRGLDPNVRLKPSGVEWLGDIPEHWDVKRLKWVTRLQRGYDLPQDKRTPGTVPVVSSGGVIDTHCEARAKGPGIVMGRYGSTDAVFFMDEDFWPHNTALFVTDFHGNHRKWCFYLLRTISKADYSSKSAVPGVDRKDLYEIYVPQPPLDEQRFLVQSLEERLKTYETAIGRTEREIALMLEYRTRLVADVVTGQIDVRAAAAKLPEEPVERESLDDEALVESEQVLNESDLEADTSEKHA